MAVAETDKVDIFSIDPSGHVVLTILDSTDPEADSIANHLVLLQAKINSYLAFVDTGQMATEFPVAAGRHVVVRAVFMHDPSSLMRDFLEGVRSILEGQGIAFSVEGPGGEIDL